MRRSKVWKCIIALSVLLVYSGFRIPDSAFAQGLHFSQFYNAPMLTSAANTGLMSDQDYRFGANYRTQWASVPVPYTTFSAYGDAQLFRRRNQTNWLGLGAAIFNDRSGDGNLSMTRVEGFAAYHLELGPFQMLSVGLSAASVQRSVDLTKLSFDAQWTGYTFDRSLANGERNAVNSTGYLDVGAGVNYAAYPTDLVYMKFGISVDHINNPKESFYGKDNTVGMRPTGYVDVLARVGNRLVANPSMYYTTQKGAYEFLYGTLLSFLTGTENLDGSFIIGAYHRFNDAVIGVAGYEWRNLRVMASYDYSISEIGAFNNHSGALEFGIRYQGSYTSNGMIGRKELNCPRF